MVHSEWAHFATQSELSKVQSQEAVMGNPPVINEQLLQEVREVNLAYLVLAQHMIRADRAQALYRLGVSEEVSAIIDQLTPAQLMKIAASNQLILRFRFDDDVEAQDQLVAGGDF